MADAKISALTAATVLADTDELVLASAGASKKITGANLKASMPAPSAGALTLLSTTTLASPGTFDVSSISGSYNDLILVAILRQSGTGAFSAAPRLTLNNDTSGGHYYRERFQASASTGVFSESLGANWFGIGEAPDGSGLANMFETFEATIPGYASTTWLKTVHYHAAWATASTTGAFFFQHGFGLWNSTAAVSRVTVVADTGTFVTGSQLRIYGRL